MLLVASLILAGPSALFLGGSADTDAASAIVTRAPLGAPACGDTLTVTLDIDWENEEAGRFSLSIEEFYPSDWQAIGTTGGGGTAIDGRITWFTFNPGVESVQYTLQVPDDAEGTFTFEGKFRDGATSGSNKIVDGATTLEVVCGEEEEHEEEEEQAEEPGDEADTGGEGETDPPGESTQVIRQDPGVLQCGETVTLTLELDWGGDRDDRHFFLEENQAPGWSASAPSAGGNVDDSNLVKTWLTDPSITSVSYDLAVPGDAEGTFPVQGEYRDDTLTGSDASPSITGATSLTVECADPEDDPAPSVGAQVNRDDLPTAQCGQPLDVHLHIVWNDADDLFIEEEYPAGWTIEQISGGGSSETPGQVKWFLSDSAVTQVSYSLNVPDEAEGTFSFAGEFRDSLLESQEPNLLVAGSDSVTVTCEEEEEEEDEEEDEQEQEDDSPSGLGPQPSQGGVTRSLDPVCSGTFTVTLQVEPAEGTSAWFVDEAPPLGLAVGEISGGGTFNVDEGEIRWVELSGDPATLTYELIVPAGISEDTAFDWDGEFRFHPVMDQRALVTGDTGIATQCLDLHAFDQSGDCVFGDDDLFALIDAWKLDDASDDALFSGIDHWKLNPDTYC